MAKRSRVDDACVRELAQALGLLADETRLKIVCQLARREQNVTSLCKSLSVKQPTVSHHLGLLRIGRLILNRRDGKRMIYGLNTNMLRNMTSKFSGVFRGKK